MREGGMLAISIPLLHAEILGGKKETGNENILHACKHVLQGSTVGRAFLFKV